MKTCAIFHRWKVVRDTGYTVCSECIDCNCRKAKQPENGGYQPIDRTWLEEKK